MISFTSYPSKNEKLIRKGTNCLHNTIGFQHHTNLNCQCITDKLDCMHAWDASFDKNSFEIHSDNKCVSLQKNELKVQLRQRRAVHKTESLPLKGWSTATTLRSSDFFVVVGCT